jgi:Ca2+-binding RTX toxin-like protein
VKTIAQAKTNTAQFTYVRRTGALFFNQNGVKGGFGSGGQFADFANGLNLLAKDFAVQP